MLHADNAPVHECWVNPSLGLWSYCCFTLLRCLPCTQLFHLHGNMCMYVVCVAGEARRSPTFTPACSVGRTAEILQDVHMAVITSLVAHACTGTHTHTCCRLAASWRASCASYSTMMAWSAAHSASLAAALAALRDSLLQVRAYQQWHCSFGGSACACTYAHARCL